MKRVFLALLIFCGIAGSAVGQGKFLNSLKKGLEKVEKAGKSEAGTAVKKIITAITDNTDGTQVAGDPVFIYPEAGAWKMSLVSCDGNPATGKVILRIRAMSLLKSPGDDVRCYILNAAGQDKQALKTAPWGTAPRYDLPLFGNVEVTFQPMVEVPRTVDTVNVKFIMGIEVPDKTFELHNVPVNWIPANTATITGGGETKTVTVVSKTTETTTTTTPARRDSMAIVTGGRTEITVTGDGYDLAKKRTRFFYLDDPGDELEVIDADLFSPGQFGYSLSVGLKDSRFPVERVYKQMFGSEVTEDTRAKDYYMKHSAKALIVAERGKTPEAERNLIAENYLHYVINAFANDNAGNGLFSGGRRMIPRKELVEQVLRGKLNTDEEIIKSLDDGSRHILEYITAHPPQTSTIDYMGDRSAVRHSFEYRFYDREMALHAFVFSPITLHYEMCAWYDAVADVTFYACFYCVGYDNANMRQTIGEQSYASAKADFKKRHDLDFDAWPLQCLMLDFKDMLHAVPKPLKVDTLYFPVAVTWFVNEDGGGTTTTTKTKTKAKKTTTTINPPPPVTYTTSPNSVALLSDAIILDIAEDARYTYLAGTASAISKIWAVDKQSGEIREIYQSSYDIKVDKGDVRCLMADGRGGVYVHFTRHPIMLLRDCALIPTKMVFADKWSQYYPNLKAVLPNGDVVMLHQARNLLVDSATGALKGESETMDFSEPRGKVAVTAAGELWEPARSQSYTGLENYSLYSSFGSDPVKIDVSYTSPFGGRINGITIAPDGSVYLASRFGLHRTADGGKTWKAIKSTYSTGSFDRLAANSRSEVWGAIGDAGGYSVVRYDGQLTKPLYRTSKFDATLPDGKPVQLQTAPRLLFVDSADNLWIVGGIYSTHTVLVFNPAGIKGYSSLAAQKSVEIK